MPGVIVFAGLRIRLVCFHVFPLCGKQGETLPGLWSHLMACGGNFFRTRSGRSHTIFFNLLFYQMTWPFTLHPLLLQFENGLYEQIVIISSQCWFWSVSLHGRCAVKLDTLKYIEQRTNNHANSKLHSE